MSTTEEKATDSAAASAKPEGEQPAASAAGQGTESSESKEESASDAKQESATSEKATEASASSSTDEDAKPSPDDAASADGEGGEVLEIEVEAVEEPVDPIAELNAKVAELESGKKANYDRFLRASADLENYRKRSRRDVKDARLDERGKVLRDMLPVIDNLDRAVKHAEETNNEATKSIVEGVNLVLRQFSQALERHAVTPLDAVGKPFDPALHEAVSQAPSADHPPGTIVSALQAGYMMDGRLLRPALVVVSVAMPAEEKPAKEEAPEEKADEAKSAAADIIDVESKETAASVEAASDDSSSDPATGDAPADETSDKSASSSDEESSSEVASDSAEDGKGAEPAADAEPSKAEAQDKE